MNLNLNNDTIQNSMIEEYDIPNDLEFLNKWTFPKIESKMVYKLGTFERLGLKQVVKTTEESISIYRNEIVICLLNKKDILPFQKTHKFLHIGLVQIAFKTLTLEGLPERFLAPLKDDRNLNWKQSVRPKNIKLLIMGFKN